jgi:UDPglucose 6-dehydrogenase/GDP-mannose 6-dehydrogenase
MRLTVVGTGYVGLVTGVCLAERGHQVVCVDVDGEKVERINRGQSPIHEEGLEKLLERNLAGRFRASTDLEGSVQGSELSMIAVGTPFDGQVIDLAQVAAAASQIGSALRNREDYHVVVVKSTVVPGTTEDLVRKRLEDGAARQVGKDLGLGMNPEFLTEGQAVDDFMRPDRIVLGAADEQALAVLERLYEDFEDVPKLRVNLRTAEMMKYAANAMLATAISFSNELANLCSALGGIDVAEVTRSLQLSNYLSPFVADGGRVPAPLASFFEAGCGYGGSCLPKDVKALIAHGRGVGEPMELLAAVDHINAQQPGRMARLLGKHFPSLEGVRVSVLGVAFKPGTDDTRESPAIPIIQDLLRAGARVTAYDPIAELPKSLLQGGEVPHAARTLSEALREAEAVVLVTRWEEFRRVPGMLRELKRSPVLVDGRRMLDRNSVPVYEGVGLEERA